MVKKCNSCNEEKNLTEFRKDKSKPDGYRYECKTCSRAYHRSAYMQKYSQDVAKRSKQRYDDVTDKIAIIKARGCVVCSEDTPQLMEFHHVDPTGKDFNIGPNKNRSWDKIKLELSKCVQLCCNCHRKVHANLLSVIPEGNMVDVTDF